jgi:hypothetical protein
VHGVKEVELLGAHVLVGVQRLEPQVNVIRPQDLGTKKAMGLFKTMNDRGFD